MTTSHLDPLRATIHQTQVSLVPSPWEIAGKFVVVGLLDVGFDRDSELLLVSSSSGLGVIDCVTGQKVARDNSETLFTDRYLECQGIGPLEGKTIRMAGIYGGSLPRTATDGWTVETVCLQ